MSLIRPAGAGNEMRGMYFRMHIINISINNRVMRICERLKAYIYNDK